MKKLIFISLLVIPLCKGAASVPESWTNALKRKNISNVLQSKSLMLSGQGITALPDPLYLPKLQVLDLSNNPITALPKRLMTSNLKRLYLSDTDIKYIDPQILEDVPRLKHLNLLGTKVTKQNVDMLKAARPELKIEYGEEEDEECPWEKPTEQDLFWKKKLEEARPEVEAVIE